MPLMAKFLRIATVVAAALASVACDERPAQWDAFIYTGENLLTNETIRGFKTFELCQQAAIDRLRAARADGGGAYECGYKCGPSEYGVDVCKETRK